MDLEDFYHSPAWQRKRAYILRRDGYLCQRCRRYGRVRQADTVHHIQELEDRPDLALDNGNLISLCRGCHNKLHPEKGGRRGGYPPHPLKERRVRRRPVCGTLSNRAGFLKKF